MADIEISVKISNVFKEVARRSSVATSTDAYYVNKGTEDKQYSQLHGEGDRITTDFTKEAAKEVLKAFINRQGDVTGLGFEYDTETNSGYIIYRVAENEDPLPDNQTASITTRLTENVKDAIVYFVLLSLYKTDGNQSKEAMCLAKTNELIDMLSGDLHRLHD